MRVQRLDARLGCPEVLQEVEEGLLGRWVGVYRGGSPDDLKLDRGRILQE